MLQRISTAMIPALVLWLIASTAQAENNEQTRIFGDYEVHYNVVNSTFFTTEMAGAYGITRSRRQAVVMVSVRERVEDGETRAQRAMVTGTTSDLIHSTELDFRELDEGDAIYYIAEFRLKDKEKRDFRLKVQPDPNRRPFEINFNKTLYAD